MEAFLLEEALSSILFNKLDILALLDFKDAITFLIGESNNVIISPINSSLDFKLARADKCSSPM